MKPLYFNALFVVAGWAAILPFTYTQKVTFIEICEAPRHYMPGAAMVSFAFLLWLFAGNSSPAKTWANENQWKAFLVFFTVPGLLGWILG